ncbi:MAG: NAD(P) transhydrogenase subunit alpha [Alphaproteobacteria bacterium]|nr:NAD(P) transhydrogenase subunit alpha [Alphaproteobacteria bacterium]
MIIAIPKETAPGETRVAASPETVRRYTAMNCGVRVETEAGTRSGFDDARYREAGAEIVPAGQIYEQADIILKIRAPLPDELPRLRNGQTIIASFADVGAPADFAVKDLTCFALEKIPRISRVQSMDILSSQSNIAGYKAVIDAAAHAAVTFPLLMTAAGTLAPARVLILGIGVAGLQAAATAKRLGAQVYASDIRPETEEQIRSLGARFVSADAVAERLAQTDILITAALSPGKPAPQLISADMLQTMPEGGVVLDLAAASGGNVEGTQDGKTARRHGLTLIGAGNLAAGLPHSASRLFAQNVLNFLTLAFNPETAEFNFDFADEIIASTCIVKNGRLFGKENK